MLILCNRFGFLLRVRKVSTLKARGGSWLDSARLPFKGSSVFVFHYFLPKKVGQPIVANHIFQALLIVMNEDLNGECGFKPTSIQIYRNPKCTGSALVIVSRFRLT